MRQPRTGVLARETPRPLKGIGLPRIADIYYAAFVGAEEMTVPRFGDETFADGTAVVPGLANHLTPFVGDAKSISGPSSRYLRFIGSGLNLGKTFLHSWDFMRAEEGDAPGSSFLRGSRQGLTAKD